jgi:hypothetical protein
MLAKALPSHICTGIILFEMTKRLEKGSVYEW